MDSQAINPHELQPQGMTSEANHNYTHDFQESTCEIQNTTVRKVPTADDYQNKKAVILLGQRLFLSNFLLGSFNLLYLTIFYVGYLGKVNTYCLTKVCFMMIGLFSLSDLLMLTSYGISFYALIYRCNKSLVVCIRVLKVSIILKMGALALSTYGMIK